MAVAQSLGTKLNVKCGQQRKDIPIIHVGLSIFEYTPEM